MLEQVENARVPVQPGNSPITNVASENETGVERKRGTVGGAAAIKANNDEP